jgi:hypothetical protein
MVLIVALCSSDIQVICQFSFFLCLSFPRPLVISSALAPLGVWKAPLRSLCIGIQVTGKMVRVSFSSFSPPFSIFFFFWCVFYLFIPSLSIQRCIEAFPVFPHEGIQVDGIKSVRIQKKKKKDEKKGEQLSENEFKSCRKVE